MPADECASSDGSSAGTGNTPSRLSWRSLSKQRRREVILELRAQKFSWREIGERLGITGSRAHQIGTGKTGHKAGEPRPETIRSYLAKRKREADEHFRVIEAMLKAGLCE